MNQDDRYRTTSWDAGEVRRSAGDRQERRPAQRPEGQTETGPSRPAPQAASRPRKKRRKKKRTNPFLALLLWLAIVAAASVICASVGWMLANDFAALNKTPFKEVAFKVTESLVSEVVQEPQEDGSIKEITHYDMEKVAAALKEEGLIEYDWFFRLFCWFYKADAKISQGTFSLNTDMDYMALVRNMRSSGGSAVTVDITIPEGSTVHQIIALLAKEGVGSADDLEETAANYVFEGYDFIDNENLGNASRLEGYLFPDTYNFYVGGRTELAFERMLDNFENKVYNNDDLSEAFTASQEAGYSLSDILTIASLIEKETDGSDRDKIASVIYNRLNNDGETHHLLQIDAALVYAAKREITQADYTDLDSPYNLYKNTGLPPTPIANPGIAAIQAALHPADTNYYFYVLGKDSKHVFSETLAQHNKAIAQAGG